MKIILLVIQKFFHKKARYTHLLAFIKYNSYLKLSNLIFNEYERRSNKTILSIDGISGESYQKYRIGGCFEVVLSNLKELISLKKEMRSSTPFIEWQFLVFRHNEQEIESARKLAVELGVDHIVFMPAYTEDASFDSSDKKYHLPKTSPLSKRSECKHLWSTLTGHWDGAVVPCCYDYYGEIPYGNLLIDDVDQVWNNQKFQESRRIVKTGHEYGSKDLYCNYCVRNIKQTPVI